MKAAVANEITNRASSNRKSQTVSAYLKHIYKAIEAAAKKGDSFIIFPELRMPTTREDLRDVREQLVRDGYTLSHDHQFISWNFAKPPPPAPAPPPIDRIVETK